MEKIYIFDEFGDRYQVENIDAMMKEIEDEALEVIYKPTRYYHEFNKTVLQLVELGKIQQMEGTPYDVEGVERGLKYFEDEITKRFGAEKLKGWQDETDAQWEASKPNIDDIPLSGGTEEKTEE